VASAVIASLNTQSGNDPRKRRIAEKAGQTFLLGVPLQYDNVAFGMKEWDGVTIAGGIAGVSKEPASNLAATGVRQFQTLSNSPVPNQPLAQPIVRGAPYNDGRVGFELADEDVLYFAQVGPAQVVAATDLMAQYGMTKDTDGHWFVDKNKVGAAAVCQVVKLDTIDTVRGVQIVFLPAVQQVLL
jgi:hypothetical protein